MVAEHLEVDMKIWTSFLNVPIVKILFQELWVKLEQDNIPILGVGTCRYIFITR